MNLKNPWVGYIDRSFQSIKSAILARMGETIPEITDHSDSNILVVIIESFAGVAEMLGYYIDNMAREAWVITCRRYSSMVKHAKDKDYRIKTTIPASTSVYLDITRLGGADPFSTINIPIGIIFKALNGYEFITTRDVELPSGVNKVELPVKQKKYFIDSVLGTTTNLVDQIIIIGKEYVNGSMELRIDTEIWELQETLGFSNAYDKHFIIDVNEKSDAYISFGDGINGAIPTPGKTVYGSYYLSRGESGNVEANAITTTDFDWSTIGIESVVITSDKAVGGTGYEDMQRMRRSIPLSIRTLQRAVTAQDYEDIALLCPGVAKAKVFFNCGKFVNIFIAPNGGGIASTQLLDDVELYFDDKKMITTFIDALPCGESVIEVDLTVTGRFRVDGAQLRNDIMGILLKAYSFENSDINMPVRTSDLISLVDNYENVDYLKLNSIYLTPYIRPGFDSTPIAYDLKLKPGSVSTVSWLIQFSDPGFILFKEGVFQANMTLGVPYSDPANIMTLTILPSAYQPGDEWGFKTYRVNEDIIPEDYSIPVMKPNSIKLNIIEQFS